MRKTRPDDSFKKVTFADAFLRFVKTLPIISRATSRKHKRRVSNIPKRNNKYICYNSCCPRVCLPYCITYIKEPWNRCSDVFLAVAELNIIRPAAAPLAGIDVSFRWALTVCRRRWSREQTYERGWWRGHVGSIAAGTGFLGKSMSARGLWS